MSATDSGFMPGGTYSAYSSTTPGRLSTPSMLLDLPSAATILPSTRLSSAIARPPIVLSFDIDARSRTCDMSHSAATDGPNGAAPSQGEPAELSLGIFRRDPR